MSVCTRSGLVVAAIMAILVSAPAAHAQSPTHFSLPAQPLADSLRALGTQTNTSVVFDPATVAGKQAPALEADLSLDEALRRLLAGSGIRHQFLNDKTVVLEPAPAPSTTDNSARTTSNTELEEIVVTAQKKSERLQDVPVPVTAITGESLNQSNQLRLQDFFARVPTLNFSTGLRGEPALAIRGITTTWSGNPTVGIVVDDVPYGASTANGGGFTAPDIDPSDIERLEVLRGPQGTLYGASSLGGLLKFVTVDPSMSAVSGRIQAGLSGVRNGDDVGYNVRGAINVPLSESFALRASGFTRRDPGYIDDPARDAKGVNWGEASGGRVSGLWQVSDAFSLKLSALMQDKDRHGSPEIHRLPGLGDLEQSTLRGTGDYSIDTRLYSLTAKVKLGTAELIALSGYNDNAWSSNVDNTSFCGSDGNGWSDTLGVSGCAFPEQAKVKKYTQELRLSGAAGARVEWLLGAFYTYEKTDWLQSYLAIDPASGASRGALVDYVFGPTTYEEYAGFADVTYHFSDRFDVQLGGRQSRNQQKHDESGIFQVFGDFPYLAPTVRTDGSAFTYLLTPRFKVSKDLMLYARIASGYRPGGPNALSALGFPSDFGPDKSRNYELGAKGNLRDGALSFDVSAYYIDWQDIQIPISDRDTGFNYVDNAGRARSQGVDLSIEARPFAGFMISGWVAWNDAKLTEAFPADATAAGVSGDRLPFSSRYSGNLSVSQQFPLSTALAGFVSGTLSYVGEREGIFVPSPVRQTLPDYTQVDLLAGARMSSWTLSVFVNNLTDRRGVLAGGIGSSNPNAFTYIQPRTVGLSVARDF